MSVVKIKIESLYKIFGTSPKMGMEHVKNGVGKDELLTKYSHVPVSYTHLTLPTKA